MRLTPTAIAAAFLVALAPSAVPADAAADATTQGATKKTTEGPVVTTLAEFGSGLASGSEIVLDRPTSLELVGDTAYVVGLAGTIVTINHL